MEQIQIPQTLQRDMAFHTSYCEKHTYIKNGEVVVKPIQNMILNGIVTCPRCVSEQNEKVIQAAVQNEYDQVQRLRQYNVLSKQSIIEDENILNACFTNFREEGPEEKANKNIVLDVVDRYKKGQIFNLILQGEQGTGKSHLAYSVLKEINETKELDVSCLFVSIESMFRLVKDSFRNKDSKYSESYFVDLLSKVDFLTLDDLGAETGAIDTDKTATDFVQRVLYAIGTTRQNKATILTTNLPSKKLFEIYDKKTVSRLLKNPKFVIFKDTKDKRISSIPF
jgi:DNA replication protein DnaC